MFKKYYCLSFLIFSLVTPGEPDSLRSSVNIDNCTGERRCSACIYHPGPVWPAANLIFRLKNALAKGPVVVYFYPSAYTGGCDL